MYVAVPAIRDTSATVEVRCLPNPTSGLTTIEIRGIERPEELGVVDMLGRTIVDLLPMVEYDKGSGLYTARYIAGDLPAGMYVVRVASKNGGAIERLLVR